MRIDESPQGTPGWITARCGVPSASNFDMIITSKGESSKQREKYLFRLAGETVSGIPEETYKNSIMERGILMEEEARQLYQIVTGKEVKQVGFCIAEGYGASPDGMIDDNGCLEIKCPTMAVHVGYLLDNVLPTEYFQQTQGQLLATGREWVDFFSYYPGLRPLLIRVNRDEKFLKLLRIELEIFCKELKEIVQKIR